MYKLLILLLLSLFLWNETPAQHRPKYVLEGQVLGNAPFLAAKISRNFWINDNNHVTIGTGYGYLPASASTIPIDLTLSTGRNNRFFELGLVGDFYFITPKEGPDLVFSPLIGYKSISDKRVVFRFHFTPTILGGFGFWGGLSVGGVLDKRTK
jgi:hypothetical protein